jgi:hypothetical protein
VTDEPLGVLSTAALSPAQVASLSVQSASKAVPGAEFGWPAGQSRQEVEPGAGWYFKAGHEVQPPPATPYLPAGQPVQSARRAVPVPVVMLPAGQSRQEVEAGAGWYLEAGQEVQAPAEAYLPAGQSVQSARRAEPVALVNWPAGQSRQEVEASSGWYLEAGHATHPAGTQSLKPAQLAP